MNQVVSGPIDDFINGDQNVVEFVGSKMSEVASILPDPQRSH